jgi:polar amino acid transport system substrate-binding protein
MMLIMTDEIRQQLAPTGRLRAAINLSNFLLVTGRSRNGDPQGVAPDLAGAIAERLGVALSLVPFAEPGALADAADQGVWDICLIGAEPARAQKILFTAAYVEIPATYLVPAGSKLQHAGEVDQPGVRVAVAARTAYDLWLLRNITNAQLVHAEGFDATFELFVRDRLDALACLKSRLLTDAEKLPGSRILAGQFTAVQQSVGTGKGNAAGLGFLRRFVEEAKASGLVARLIERHRVQGLSLAPPDTAMAG